MLSISSVAKRRLWLGLALGLPCVLYGQNTYSPQGGEYALIGALAGDQTRPQLSVNATGGYVVWQDNATDGDGLGISARRLNSLLSGTLGTFRVNATAAGNQENPQVALLRDGGAAFVWQGGGVAQQIHARFLNSNGVFTTGDLQVNTENTVEKMSPVVAVLADGNVAVAWSSYGQDGGLEGIYAQRLSPTGTKLGGEIPVNQTTALNQRNPALAALADGRFVVAWVSERDAGPDPNVGGEGELYRIEIFARIFQTNGAAAGSEFRVNVSTNACASPAVAGTADGGFVVVWSQKALVNQDTNAVLAENGWDIFARHYNSVGAAARSPARVNTQVYGDQYFPRVSARENDCLVVWTSLGQDGSREGVFGQFLGEGGLSSGSELAINSTTASQQIQPAVAADGGSRFLVVWSTFAGLATGFDLAAKRYGSDPGLPAPAAPYVMAYNDSRFYVTWPDVSEFTNVVGFELFLDGTNVASVAGTNLWLSPKSLGLAAGSTHAFQIAYCLDNGRVSPRSAATSGRTWGSDDNWDGVPDDWQQQYWGPNQQQWPSADADSDGDGVSNRQEFLAGTNPVDGRSVLRMRLESTGQGWRLGWNTQPGLLYQVQFSTNFTSWANLGSARFAAGSEDALPVSGAYGASYYRVIRVR